MKLVCGPSTSHPAAANGALRVILYGQATEHNHGSAGEAIKWDFYRRRLEAAPRAWDLLSIALSVITADFAGKRAGSSDGWTRDFELDIAVGDPDFWDTQANAIVRALGFLTTDRWRLNFHDGGYQQVPTQAPARSGEDCVVLLSGGLDSLIGAVDLAASGKKPLAVSQRVRGDAAKQSDFAGKIGGGLKHLQLNHNASATGDEEASQRARSLIFIALGVLAATTLQRYYKGGVVPLYVCENGFIALNPPLTGSRLGSLSTRTAHPEFLGRFQAILSAA